MWGMLIVMRRVRFEVVFYTRQLNSRDFSFTFPLRDKQKESPRQPTNLIVLNEKSMDEKKFVFPKNENGSHPYISQ